MSSTNGHGPERVALYLRVSSEEQRERETIEIQRDFLSDYCKLYGLEVEETYADNGISGTVYVHERPEGRRLLEDAKAGKFDTVLVYKLDRLGRSLLVTVDGHDRLESSGVALRSATEPVDTSTPSGRLIFQMLASFAEYERANIRERTAGGLRRAYKNGKHTGRIPYGYKLAPGGYGLEVVEDEARVVREIISNVAEGATLYSESKRLNDEGVPSPGYRMGSGPRRHGRAWFQPSVASIVHQRAYGEGIHVITLSSGETIERVVPAIVGADLQRRALSRLEENKRFAGANLTATTCSRALSAARCAAALARAVPPLGSRVLRRSIRTTGASRIGETGVAQGLNLTAPPTQTPQSWRLRCGWT